MLGNAIFNVFQTAFWASSTIKIKTMLTIFYVHYRRSCPQNLNHGLLEKSEMTNLLIPKKYIQCLKFMLFFYEKTCSAMTASVSLARTPFWHMRKPGIWSRRSTTLRSASTFYTSTEMLTRLKLLKCTFT